MVSTTSIRIGLISDTHGLLRPEALAYLRGSNLIVHAGDICEPGVLVELARIAPTTAVRGNNDHGTWAEGLKAEEIIRIGELAVCVVHDIATLSFDPASRDVGVVVFGHSHKPSVEVRGGVLHVNPGSAGPRRFRLPISAGSLRLDARHASVSLVDLGVTPVNELASVVVAVSPTKPSGPTAIGRTPTRPG